MTEARKKTSKKKASSRKLKPKVAKEKKEEGKGDVADELELVLKNLVKKFTSQVQEEGKKKNLNLDVIVKIVESGTAGIAETKPT